MVGSRTKHIKNYLQQHYINSFAHIAEFYGSYNFKTSTNI